jgi:hypothetical protein
MERILGMYMNGNTRTVILSDGTKIRETDDDEFRPDFADNIDIKLLDRCDMGCKFCHEGSTPDGKLGDIMNEKFVNTLHPYQEVALGGGNVLEHPDLIPFLKKLKDKKVIANITLNQRHFEKKIELVDMLVKEELIYGLGISLVNPTDKFIELVQRYPNAIIHTINGILSPDDVEKLSNKGLKLLILGYKKLRRGEDYWYGNDHENIMVKQMWLKDNLPNMIDKFNVVSFDNLAIEQLNVRALLTQKEWDEFYSGDDGSHTFFIDTVEKKFSRDSMADFDKRYDLLDSVDEMFRIIVEENNRSNI